MTTEVDKQPIARMIRGDGDSPTETLAFEQRTVIHDRTAVHSIATDHGFGGGDVAGGHTFFPQETGRLIARNAKSRNDNLVTDSNPVYGGKDCDAADDLPMDLDSVEGRTSIFKAFGKAHGFLETDPEIAAWIKSGRADGKKARKLEESFQRQRTESAQACMAVNLNLSRSERATMTSRVTGDGEVDEDEQVIEESVAKLLKAGLITESEAKEESRYPMDSETLRGRLRGFLFGEQEAPDDQETRAQLREFLIRGQSNLTREALQKVLFEKK